MKRTTIVLDDKLLEEARCVLGTRGIKETIDRALHEVITAYARRALLERLRTLEGLDLLDEEVMRQAWRE